MSKENRVEKFFQEELKQEETKRESKKKDIFENITKNNKHYKGDMLEALNISRERKEILSNKVGFLSKDIINIITLNNGIVSISEIIEKVLNLKDLTEVERLLIMTFITKQFIK